MDKQKLFLEQKNFFFNLPSKGLYFTMLLNSIKRNKYYITHFILTFTLYQSCKM